MVSIKIGFSTFSVVILSAIIFFQYVGAVEYRVVETQSGSVRGQLAKTFHKQKPYFEFKGIPYAKPPIGELRFKARVPFEIVTFIRRIFFLFKSNDFQRKFSTDSIFAGNSKLFFGCLSIHSVWKDLSEVNQISV